MKNKTGFIYSCIVCGVGDLYAPLHRTKTAKTCSRKCASKLSQKKFFKNCEICSTQFEFIASRVDKAKYCSRKCYYKGMHFKSLENRTCRFCNKNFKIKKSSKNIYCSRSCMGIDRRNIPNQLTNVRKWFQISGLIKKCESCGYDKNLDILGIHHKNHNHFDNRLENLAVLCANCHSIQHKKHIVHGGDMTLIKGYSKKSISKNIKTEMKTKSQKQSVAIALDVARKAKKAAKKKK